MIRFLLFIVLVSLGWACQTSPDAIERPDVSNIPVDVDIIRLEQELFSSQSKSKIKAFLEQNKSFARNFLRIDEYPHDSVVTNQLYSLIQNPSLDTVYQESQQIFGDMEIIRKDFETAFKYIKYYYPEFEAPVIYTIVTGFGNDLYVSDEMIVIGLDYFLGEQATYRPAQIPNYILRRYTPAHVVPTVMLLLSQQYNAIDKEDRTMLADMIYYGKSYYFTDFVLPQTPDSLLIGYTAEEMAGVHANERRVWEHFLKGELLYESNHMVKKKYLDERPNTLEIGNKAPGRIATWLGWQITKDYMREQEEVSLPDLMANPNARQILEASKYKGSR
jgi:gliding motility-associated lipoprotein GldB